MKKKLSQNSLLDSLLEPKGLSCSLSTRNKEDLTTRNHKNILLAQWQFDSYISTLSDDFWQKFVERQSKGK